MNQEEKDLSIVVQLRALAEATRAQPPSSAELRNCTAAGIELDYSKSFITPAAAELLASMAQETDLPGKFKAMAQGEKINRTEDRAAEHMAQRSPDWQERPGMREMLAFATALRAGEVKGCTGATIKHILHIGIGGSYLGPRLLYEALKDGAITCDFVANGDPEAMDQALAACDPAQTLVVAVSKSGTTPETIQNAQAALKHFRAALDADPSAQLANISTNEQAMREALGPGRFFPMEQSVGGRFSLWSSVSLAAAAACGAEAFTNLLAGARAIDEHVLAESGWDNIAVAKALVHIWQQILWDAQTHGVIAYANRLRSLPAYLQQQVMESNGKSVTIAGEPVAMPTSPIWWGGEGTNDQHSYYQLLLQGCYKTPMDFIYARRPQRPEQHARHQEIVAHCLGQSSAMHHGVDLKTCMTALQEGQPRELAKHKVVHGGQPINLIACERMDARSIGALLAMYEHTVAALGWLWDINSFDQWGVEFGKSNYKKALAALRGGDSDGFDASTQQALQQARD